MTIWLDDNIRTAIAKAADQHGSQSALARVTGIDQGNISRYISGRTYKMDTDLWQKLFPKCKQFLPPEKVDAYDPANIDEFPQSPPLNSDFKRSDNEVAIPDTPRFKAVPVISIAQAAEYEPIEPLIDYLREVSERAQVFVDVKDYYFAVEITGDSMAPDYPDGSVALVAAGEFPERGDIVVAKFSTGQVVIKEYHRKNNVISLLSRNPSGQNFEWNIKEKPGFIQWMFPVLEIVLKPRNQRKAKTRM